MSLSVRNLDWLRKLTIGNEPAAGQKLYESFQDVMRGMNTLERQTNSNLNGHPGPPVRPQDFQVIPHPLGVDVAINHQGEFYQGVQYEVDYASTPNFQGARTHILGPARNAVIPLGEWNGYFQVRARYPGGQSTAPLIYGGQTPQMVRAGSVSRVTLLPSQGSGTTLPHQPPGFGSSFRSKTGAPPLRPQQKGKE